MRMLTGLILLLSSAMTHAAGFEANFADLYETHSKSVVTIYTASISRQGNSARTSQGVGSGVLIEYAITIFRNGKIIDLIAGAPASGIFSAVH